MDAAEGDEALQPLGLLEADEVADEVAPVLADEADAVEPERVEQAERLVAQVPQREPASPGPPTTRGPASPAR